MGKGFGGLLLGAALLCSNVTMAQDAKTVDAIYREVLTNDYVLNNLKMLCEQAPARLSGSDNNAKAQQLVKHILSGYGLDSVWLRPVKVPHWQPGTWRFTVKENNGKEIEISSAPLGMSAGTNGALVSGDIIEIKSKAELEKMGNLLKGKVVFLNERMDTSYGGYSKAGWQRMAGPSIAAGYGAAAVVIRSLSATLNNYPHTGVTFYSDSTKRIPAFAISTNDAERLSDMLKKGMPVKGSYTSTTRTLPDATGNNVFGEIKGSVNPNNVIMMNGHLDSWFLSQCAQDNGTGVVMVIEALRALKAIGYTPKNTIRVVAYQDEEVSLQGIKHIAKENEVLKENYLFDLEVDSGVGIPQGVIMFDTDKRVDAASLLMNTFLKEHGFAKVTKRPLESGKHWPLNEKFNAPIYYFDNINKNYFNVHHSAVDTVENVNVDLLKKSAAAIAAFIYLMDNLSVN